MKITKFKHMQPVLAILEPDPTPISKGAKGHPPRRLQTSDPTWQVGKTKSETAIAISAMMEADQATAIVVGRRNNIGSPSTSGCGGETGKDKQEIEARIHPVDIRWLSVSPFPRFD